MPSLTSVPFPGGPLGTGTQKFVPKSISTGYEPPTKVCINPNLKDLKDPCNKRCTPHSEWPEVGRRHGAQTLIATVYFALSVSLSIPRPPSLPPYLSLSLSLSWIDTNFCYKDIHRS